jgi:predicted 3-demethylubiquinone-9 3-methyltransferase (glyoxalase superfamily)
MQSVTPFLWYNGRIEEAVKFYRSIFKGSKLLSGGKGKDALSATLRLNGQDLILFNGGPHYKLTPACSLFISCKTQKEVDYYWSRLVQGGAPSRCGWLTDKFGLSWQVIPEILGKGLSDKDPAKAGRVMKAMLKMGKIEVKELKKAYAGT